MARTVADQQGSCLLWRSVFGNGGRINITPRPISSRDEYARDRNYTHQE
jgi:hypothetical protein